MSASPPRRKAHSAANKAVPASPSIGVALGSGGARGLAHIAVLEAFDELGLRPQIIAGASMGALIGAAYASGLDAVDLRTHVVALLADRLAIARRLLAERTGGILNLIDRIRSGSDFESRGVIDAVLPETVPQEFADLALPLLVIATDYYKKRERVLDTGPLRTAIAASTALPGFMRPQVIGGSVLIDGGVTNPLPFNHLRDRADIVVAVDVIGGPSANRGRSIPSGPELVFRSIQIMQHIMARGMIAQRPPDILIRPPVERFRLLDFLKGYQILEAAQPAKEELKRSLDRVLSRADLQRNP